MRLSEVYCRRRVFGLPLRGPGVYLNPLSHIGSPQEGRKKPSDIRTFLIWAQESRDDSRDDSGDDLQDNSLQHHRPVPLSQAPPTRASPLRRPSAMATASFSSAAAPRSAKPSGHCPLCTHLRTLLPDLEDASTGTPDVPPCPAIRSAVLQERVITLLT